MSFLSPEEAGKKLDALIQEYLYLHPEINYQRALDIILEKYPDLKAAYARGVAWPDKTQEPVVTKHNLDWYLKDHSGEYEDAREEVDRRVRSYQHKNPTVDYDEAMAVVFAEDPDLRDAYSKS